MARGAAGGAASAGRRPLATAGLPPAAVFKAARRWDSVVHFSFSSSGARRSEEHTSELQSHHDLVCRLLLEKKKNKHQINFNIKKNNKKIKYRQKIKNK